MKEDESRMGEGALDSGKSSEKKEKVSKELMESRADIRAECDECRSVMKQKRRELGEERS